MKVISLLQPWASLVVIGAKKIETRSWNTKYRGPLLIHASKKMSNVQKFLAYSEPFASALKDLNELSLGAIIGKVDLKGTSTTDFYLDCKNGGIPITDHGGDWEKEIAFGDYSAGRFGWLLSNPIAFSHHIQAKGSLGLWEYDGQLCHSCGCTEYDCRHCIEKTGQPCHWVAEDLCSACANH